MPQKKKKTQTRKKAPAKSDSPQKQPAKNVKTVREGNGTKAGSVADRIAPVLLILAAVFFGVCVLFGEGTVGEGMKNFLRGVLGGAAYLLPVFLILRAVLWARDVREGRLVSRTVCGAVTFLCAAALFHVLGSGATGWSVAEHYEAGIARINGGVVGGLLGETSLECFGKVCSLILLFAAAILCGLYALGVTPRGAFIYLAYKIKYAGEKRAERKADEEERKKNEPTARQVREEEYLAYLRDKRRRRAKTEDEDRPLAPAASTAPSIYHISRLTRRKPKVEFTTGEDIAADLEKQKAMKEAEETASAASEAAKAAVEKETKTVPADAGQDAENERIYEEVMRRTRERIERSRQENAETDPDGPDSPAGGEEDDGAFDLASLFVNPEDAELLDRLSETYRNPQDPKKGCSSELPTKEVRQKSASRKKPAVYSFPPIDLLTEGTDKADDNVREELEENAVRLVETLRSFKVITKIENISRGPTITRYELKPEPGTKVRSITNLVDDIALNLATTGVRIEAPIPGKSAVGIEVPNKTRTTVHLRDLIATDGFVKAKSKLTVCLGEDVAGDAVYFDIAKMPHLLIAGATGSGKSVCINSVITSLLYKATPEEVKLILIDPKKVELNIYNGIPHLLVPVVSDPKKAAGSLSWAVGEMERRYELIESVGVRDIRAFNEVTKDDPDYEYMPRIVIVIDELADLMMTAPDDVEDSICRIAQKARAAGMHLVVGTQRPSVDVITGLIKANIPSRIAFRTSSQIDSRTIIDVGSASNLIGMGDMLFAPVGALKPIRVQGAYVSESDVEDVVSYIRNVNSAYGNEEQSEKIVNEIEREAQKCGSLSGRHGGSEETESDDGGEDPMLKSAIELAIDSGKISTSLIQRRLSLGYGRAAKLIDRMEQLGYVSAPDGSKPREVLITKQDFMEMRLKDEAPF